MTCKCCEHPAVTRRRSLVEAAEALNAAWFRACMYYAAHFRHMQIVALTGPTFERFVKHAEHVDAVYSNPPAAE